MTKTVGLSLVLLSISPLMSARSVAARKGGTLVPNQTSLFQVKAISSAVNPSLVLALLASPIYTGGNEGNRYEEGKGGSQYGNSDDGNQYRNDDGGNHFGKGDEGDKFDKGDDGKKECHDGKKYGDCEDHKGPAPIPEPSTLLSFGAALVIGCGVLYSRRLRGNRK